MIQSSFTKACKEYFGYKPGQTLGDFMKEVKFLSPEDRKYFIVEFRKVGYEITGE